MTALPVRGLRVAIVGLGPSGAYAAGHLLSNSALDVRVDVFERLPTPWGLVRAGVAPDHPRIKTVTRVYEQMAGHPRFTYFGNVELGRHLTRDELRARYHAVIYAVGTPGDAPLGIPGEDLPGSVPATAFVGWYNGHPDHRDAEFDFSCRRAVVVGNGNVALDVARMLTLGTDELSRTDMADHAIRALRRSQIAEVLVIGRRGPEQAAFTPPELRELGGLAGADVDADAGELAVPAAYREPARSEATERNLALLQDYAARRRHPGRRRIALRFLLSPTRLLGAGQVQAIELVRNTLERDAHGRLRARPTPARATVPAGLVIRAVGSRGRPIAELPFDEERGIIPNQRGRIVGDDGRPTREYVVGWAKRGPTGVIGTNKQCAADTVAVLLQDMVGGRLSAPLDPDPIERLLAARQPDVVAYADWQRLDRLERERGRPAGRPRVKLTRVSEMLAVVGPGRARPAADDPLPPAPALQTVAPRAVPGQPPPSWTALTTSSTTEMTR